MRKIGAWLTAVVVVILVSTNAIYFVIAQGQLVRNQEKELRSRVDMIRISIETSAKGESMMEALIGQNLRTAAVAAEAMLPPDASSVTGEQLKQIADKLMVDDITLMKRNANRTDIVGYRSSDPKEVGISTREWGGGSWYDAFDQLLSLHNAKLSSKLTFGQFLPHFWSGPYDTSTSNPSNIDKWGYYNDGSTDYIIDPFIHDQQLIAFRKETGVDETLRRIQQTDPSLLEIGVMNASIALGDRQSYVHDNVVWYTDRKVMFGAYTGLDEEWKMAGKKAMADNRVVSFRTSEGGRPVLKSVLPLPQVTVSSNLKTDLLVSVTTDYGSILHILWRQQLQLALWVLAVTAVGLLLVLAVLRRQRKQQETVEEVQELYVDNVDTLYRSIREHRHDFANHLQIIYGMAQLGKTDALKTYIREIAGETAHLNEAVQLPIPALSALVQAKMAVAADRRIEFRQIFEDFEGLLLGTDKVTALVRILANLSDNAFDAVAELPPEERTVRLSGRVEEHALLFEVENNGPRIPNDIQARMFDHGYSTKNEQNNSGLGLAIVTRLVRQYKGQLSVESEDGRTVFRIVLPLQARERSA